MRIRFALTGALVALVAALALTAGTATAARPATSLTTPVAGTTNTGSALSGVATITGFALNSAGQLVANGTITGTLTDAAGAVTNLTDTTFSTIVTPAATGPGCQILDLTLGPLNKLGTSWCHRLITTKLNKATATSANPRNFPRPSRP